MFVLIGYRNDRVELDEVSYCGTCPHCGMEIDTSETFIATFDTKQDAEDYIKKSRLKDPYRSYYNFCAKSLLRFYDDARVEKCAATIPTIPHNPTI